MAGGSASVCVRVDCGAALLANYALAPTVVRSRPTVSFQFNAGLFLLSIVSYPMLIATARLMLHSRPAIKLDREQLF